MIKSMFIPKSWGLTCLIRCLCTETRTYVVFQPKKHLGVNRSLCLSVCRGVTCTRSQRGTGQWQLRTGWAERRTQGSALLTVRWRGRGLSTWAAPGATSPASSSPTPTWTTSSSPVAGTTGATPAAKREFKIVPFVVATYAVRGTRIVSIRLYI